MEPALLRPRKTPKKVKQDNSNSRYDQVCDVEMYYRRIYLHALGTVINAVNERFGKPGYANYKNIKRLFLSAINHKNLEPWINKDTETYECDVSKYKLEIHLKNFSTEFKDREGKSIRGIIKYIKGLPPVKRSFFSEIVILLMIAPTTNAASGRSASCLRRLKNWL